MKFDKPKFWDKRGHINLFSILLFPLSLIVIVKNYYENSKLKKNFYDCILVAVGHEQFINLDLNQFTKTKQSLIYDLKGIYNNKEFINLIELKLKNDYLNLDLNDNMKFLEN